MRWGLLNMNWLKIPVEILKLLFIGQAYKWYSVFLVRLYISNSLDLCDYWYVKAIAAVRSDENSLLTKSCDGILDS